MHKNILKILIVVLTAVTTSGCATLELLAATGISYLVSGKSLTDNVMSVALEQDCAMHRVLLDESVCDDATPEQESSTLLATTEQEKNKGITSSKPLNEDTSKATAVVARPGRASLLESSMINTGAAQLFAVVGSFNNYQFAQNRLKKYAQFDSYIVEAGTENIAYRVVVGPLSTVADMTALPTKVGEETADPWLLEMCHDGLTLKSCQSGLLAKR